MRIDRFEPALVYAAAAAAGIIPWWLIAAGVVGGAPAFAAWLLVLSITYSCCLVPSPVAATRLGLVAGALSLPVAVLAHHPAAVAVGAAALIGVCRWLTFPWGRWWIRLPLELALGGLAALMVPLFLRDGTLLQLALSLWGFFLMEGLFFLFDRWLWEGDVARDGAIMDPP